MEKGLEGLSRGNARLVSINMGSSYQKVADVWLLSSTSAASTCSGPTKCHGNSSLRNTLRSWLPLTGTNTPSKEPMRFDICEFIKNGNGGHQTIVTESLFLCSVFCITTEESTWTSISDVIEG